MNARILVCSVLFALCGASSSTAQELGSPWTLNERLRQVRQEASPGACDYDVVERQVDWDPRRTAVIVCDMWDRHWCKSATARVTTMKPD